MDGHGDEKFRDAGLLATSGQRPWSMMSAELRSHGAGEIGAFQPVNAEITMILKSARPAVSSRSSGGVRQVVPAWDLTTWLCPAGICEEATRLSDDIPEVLHVYLPHHAFAGVTAADGLDFRAGDLRYQAKVDNPVVLRILMEIVAELRSESFAGGLRMDQLSCRLIETLAADHSENERSERSLPKVRGSLDRQRLGRVIDYMEANLLYDVTVAELAEVASFSLFHFVRAFRQAAGRPPHVYLAERRMDLAKRLLAFGGHSLTDIAALCRFSSQANFTRAFHKATGYAPGRYRKLAMS